MLHTTLLSRMNIILNDTILTTNYKTDSLPLLFVHNAIIIFNIMLGGKYNTKIIKASKTCKYYMYI